MEGEEEVRRVVGEKALKEKGKRLGKVEAVEEGLLTKERRVVVVGRTNKREYFDRGLVESCGLVYWSGSIRL